jgi:hypothetical protein
VLPSWPRSQRRGPYDPGDDSRTNVGGAWAFDSEASAGDTVPTLDSIKRFLSPFEQTQLWPSSGTETTRPCRRAAADPRPSRRRSQRLLALSTQPDQVDWSKTIGQPQATMAGYADLRQLRQLPAARVTVSASSHAKRGGGRTDRVAVVRIRNTSSTPTAAFFLRADLRRGSAPGAPAAGDNTLHVAYRSAQLGGASPVVSVSGDNVAETDVPAG